MKWLLVFAGGGLGSVLRYAGSLLSEKIKSPFPWATFSVNLLGSFLIGLLAAYFLKTPHTTSYRLFLITGFCGGFTTFSTFSVEVVQLLQKQQWAMAGVYAFASLALCLLATALGFFLIK